MPPFKLQPALYLGRAFAFFMINMFFALVYWVTRPMEQVHALNKVHLVAWWLAAASLCGVLVVMYINQEVKAVLSEVKNGMYNLPGYIFSKILLAIPIMILFGIVAIPFAAFVLSTFDASHFVPAVGIWALHIFAFESAAEFFAVFFEDPILGMIGFLVFWVVGFLCCGIYLPARDMFWPVKLFYYISSFGYYVRSMVNVMLTNETFDSCDVSTNTVSPVCTSSTDGSDVLFELQKVMSVIGDVNYTRDTLAIIAIIVVTKLMFITTLYSKARRFFSPKPNAVIPMEVREHFAASIAKYMRAEKTKDLNELSLLEVFASIDKDGSGAISADEFHHFTESCEYCSVDAKDCKAIFEAIDINGDGKINFAEFCVFYRSLPLKEKTNPEILFPINV